jgi:hypothetical protein
MAPQAVWTRLDLEDSPQLQDAYPKPAWMKPERPSTRMEPATEDHLTGGLVLAAPLRKSCLKPTSISMAMCLPTFCASRFDGLLRELRCVMVSFVADQAGAEYAVTLH